MIAWLRRLLFEPVIGCDDCQAVVDCVNCGPLAGRSRVEDVARERRGVWLR